MNIKRALIALFLFLWGASAAAFPYAIDPFVSGADMAGMEVTAFFGDRTSETVTWAATGAESGAATGTDWSLSQSGDTLNEPGLDAAWTLTNNRDVSLVGFVVDAWVAGVFFDVIMEGEDPAYPLGYDEHTPGSRQGRPFTYDPDLWSPTASYSNLLSAPDLYGKLHVLIGGKGLAPGESFQFMIDTDQIPESPLYALLLLGLGGFLFRQRGVRTGA